MASTATDVAVAQEFAERSGLCATDGFFYIRRSRPSKDPIKQAKGFKEVDTFYTKSPEKLNSNWWQTYSRHYDQHFCTATLKSKDLVDARGRKVHHTVGNCVATPMVHCDIDMLKTFGLDGEPFAAELRRLIPASCYVRSSAKGCQLHFKLDTPYVWNGDRKTWREEVGDIFTNVTFHLGGDPAVARPQALMRLPGSNNCKPEYNGGFAVTAAWTDNVYTLADLEKRFPINEHIVPFAIRYAIQQAVEETGVMSTSGERHEFMMQLAGTLRRGWSKPSGAESDDEDEADDDGVESEEAPQRKTKTRKRLGGIDQRSAEGLYIFLCEYFEYDEVDALAALDTTYRLGPEEAFKTLATGWMDCQRKIEQIVHEWVKLKIWYCKYHGIHFTPVDPPDDVELGTYDETGAIVVTGEERSGMVDGVAFLTKDGQTFFVSGSGKEESKGMFANFDLRITGTLIKSDTYQKIWRGLLLCQGEAIEVELDTKMMKKATDLSDIKNWPAAATVLRPATWGHYRCWLAETAPKSAISEVPYYGFLDVREGNPTLLLPGENHDKYLWRNDGEGKDTAAHGLWAKHDQFEDVVRYLEELRDNLPGIHEARYMYPVLGWLCVCPLSSFIRTKRKGFPLLMISGLPGIGKSTLIEGLSPHLGVGGVQTASTTTMAATRSYLGSNNVMPLVMDEFRNAEFFKARALQDIFRDCWTAAPFSKMGRDGSTVTGYYAAPFALLGQTHITDEAALHRTVSIRLNRAFMDSLNKSPELKAAAEARLKWLNSPKHDGILGRIIVKWIVDNVDIIDDVIELAVECCEQHMSGLNERQFTSYASVITGLLILSQVYKEYNVKQKGWLNSTLFMPALLAADTELERNKRSDALTLQDLFNFTDKAICNAKIKRVSEHNTTYVFDQDEGSSKYSIPRYIYFEAKRWYEMLQSTTKRESVTLQDGGSFYALLEDRARQQDSPIVSFGEPYAFFRKNCVKVDVDLIIEQYSINAEGWNPDLEVEDV